MKLWEENIKKYVRESNLIEGIDKANEDENSIQAWEWLKTQRTVDFPAVSTLHYMIVKNNHWMKGYEKGYLRTINVTVGGNICPDYRKLPNLLAAWLYSFFTIEPIDAHVAFEQIHPFVDGNGRTGRMLYWWQCLQEGSTPELFSSENRGLYYNLFKQEIPLDAWLALMSTWGKNND